MALEMRAACEKCGTALDDASEAYVCSYECTFCPACSTAMADRCPNCGGELVRRPRRASSAVTPKALARRLHELWTSGDVGAISEVYGEGFVAHFPRSSELPERCGLDAVRGGILRIKAAFPDWREDVEDIVAEGNRVVTRYTSSGTHRGTFWGVAATGRRVTLPEMSIYRVAKGKIVEQWCEFDELHRMQQIGATLARPT